MNNRTESPIAWGPGRPRPVGPEEQIRPARRAPKHGWVAARWVVRATLGFALILQGSLAEALEVPEFELACAASTVAEGGTLGCTLRNAGETARAWPAVAIFHRSDDAHRALVRGRIDVEFGALSPTADVLGALWWVGHGLVGHSRIDWSGDAEPGAERSVPIVAVDDAMHEPTETFYVTLMPDGSRNETALHFDATALPIAVLDDDEPGSDASLAGLAVRRPGAASALAVRREADRYVVDVPYETTALVVVPQAAAAAATVSVAGDPVAASDGSRAIAVPVGASEVAVSVVAEDGIATRDYVVAFRRAGEPRSGEVAVEAGDFVLECPATVREDTTADCVLTNRASESLPGPVVAILHSSMDANRTLVAEDTLIPATHPAYAKDVELDAATRAGGVFEYGFGEMLSGGSISRVDVYGFEKVDRAGDIARGATATVSISVLADDLDESDEVLYVALALDGYTGLSGLIENRAPIVVRQAGAVPGPVHLSVRAIRDPARLRVAGRLWWSAPETGSENMEKYQLRVARGDEAQYGAWGDVAGGGDVWKHVVEGLAAGETYFFQVRGVNDIGVGEESVSASLAIGPWSDDASLASLHLSGVDMGTFSAATTAYAATVAHDVAWTTVTAAPSHRNAALRLVPADADAGTPGDQVSLAEGVNEIAVTVTAEDRATVRTYAVSVTRSPPPAATIAARAGSVSEGDAAIFDVSLDHAQAGSLTVTVSVTEDGTVLSGKQPSSVTFPARQSGAALSVPTADDAFSEAPGAVIARLISGTGYALDTASSATVAVTDNDVALFAVTVAPEEIEEGQTTTLTVSLSNDATFVREPEIALSVTGVAARDYTLTPASLTLAAGDDAATATLAATYDDAREASQTARIEAMLYGAVVGSATLTIADAAPVPTPGIAGVAQVGGRLEATFEEAPPADLGYRWLRGAEEIAGAAQASYAPAAADANRTLSVRAGRRGVSRASAPTGPVWPAPANPPMTGGEEELLGAVLTLESTDAFPVDIAGYGQLGDVRFGSVTGGDFEVGGTRHAVTTAAVNNQGRFVLGTRPHLTGTEGLTVYWNGHRMRAFAETTLLGERYWGTAATQPKSEYGRYWDGASDGVRVALSIRRTARVPTASIAANAATVGEGGAARYTVTVDEAPGADLAVSVSVTDEAGALVSAPPSTVTVAAGAMRATLSLTTDDDKVDEADGAVTVELLAGAGYDLGAATSATTTVTDDDVATFEVAAAPSEIVEGGASTVTVSVAGGVTFAADVGIELAVTGVSADDYELAPADLSLPAGETRMTATLTAVADEEEEGSETATVTARVDGAAVGSAAVAVRDASEDASLAALELSDVDIGAFDAAVTAYAAEVAHAIGSTTVQATPTDANASVEITDATGSTLGTRRTSALAQGANDIAARVTAEDGATRRTYAVTVTRGPRWGARLRDRDIALADASAPTGLWSDGRTVWIADVYEGVLAYALSDGARLPGRDIDVAAVSRPSALWSDGATLWVADYDGGVRAYRLADGGRLSNEDLDADVMTAAGNNIPTGLWSDGETLLVADNADGRAYAYALSDGGRAEDAEFSLRGGDLRNMQPYGLWSDGETLLATHWTRGAVRGYRLSDGARRSARDINAQAQGNSYPRGLWSDGETLWVVDYADRRLYAYAVPGLRRDGGELSELLPTSRAEGVPGMDPGPPVSIPDAGLRARVGAALGKAPGDAIGANELAALAALDARGAGVRDLAGLEHAVNLEGLDLGLNPLADVRALESLPALRTLNLDGTFVDPWALAALARLERLSLRDNGIEDLAGLASLTALRVLDVGGNRIEDLSPLAGLGSLTALRADRNVIADLSPLSGLGELATLDLRDNAIEDVSPLATLRALVELDLRGNGIADFSALDGNRRLVVLGGRAERRAADASER